jgi:hypothetical protein
MKIKVTKCSDSNWWYKGFVGKVFEVAKEDDEDYFVIHHGKSDRYLVDKTDCEIVQDKLKFSIGSKVIVRDYSEDHGKTGIIIEEPMGYYHWRIRYDCDEETELFNANELELIQESQYLTKEEALKLCIDGAKVVNEYVHGNEAHILWDDKEFMLSYDANESSTQKANGVLRGERWKLWTPPQPPTPKFTTDTFVIDKDGDYGRIVSMEYEDGTWVYSLSDCVGNDCLWEAEETELTVV